MTEPVYRAVLDKVIVEQLPEESQTQSGLQIPETARTRSLVADVIAIGPAHKLVSVGDRILYHRDAGWDLHRPGRRLMMLNSEDLHGVVIE